MSNSDWRDSEQESEVPRRSIQGRTELEDSLLAARREDQAQAKRRSAALSEALKSRPLESDPEGKIFLAQRKKAIDARRAENARLARQEQQTKFSVTLMDVWEEAAQAPQPGPDVKTGRLWWAAALAGICAFLLWCVWWLWKHAS